MAQILKRTLYRIATKSTMLYIQSSVVYCCILLYMLYIVVYCCILLYMLYMLYIQSSHIVSG